MIHNFNNFLKINEMSDNLIKFKMPIGDWSDDGHGENEDFAFQSNTPIDILQQGYKDSCKKLGVQFNHNEDYTGLPEEGWRNICVEYEDGKVSDEAFEILSQHIPNMDQFYDEDEDGYIYADGLAQLILNFIKISVPDFKWEEASTTRKEMKNLDTLNGYWNDNLNCGFGYGIFE